MKVKKKSLFRRENYREYKGYTKQRRHSVSTVCSAFLTSSTDVETIRREG